MRRMPASVAAAIAVTAAVTAAGPALAGDGTAKPTWQVDVGGDSSHFAKNTIKDWQDSYIRLGHAVSDTTQVHVLHWNSHRFGEVDRYFEGGVAHMFAPWARGYVAAGGTFAADFSPQRRGDLGGAVRVMSNAEGGVLVATWLGIDARHSAYRTGNVDYIAPGLQQYLFDGRAWLTGRYYFMDDELEKRWVGREVRLDWQVLDRVRLWGAYKDLPETTYNVTAPDASRQAGVVLGVTDAIDLTLSATRGYPRRETVGAALTVRF